MGLNHAYTPASTNQLDMDVRVKNSTTRSMRIRDFFFLAKEISIGLASSGGSRISFLRGLSHCKKLQKER